MIRLATFYDLKDINIIYNQAIEAHFQTGSTTPWTLNQRVKWFEEHNVETYPVFVMEMTQKVIGYCTLSAYRKGREAFSHVAEISYYLHRDYQKKGYGSELIEWVLKTANTFNFSVIVAILLSMNAASIKLLEKFGFEKWGVLHGAAKIDNEVCDHFYYGKKI